MKDLLDLWEGIKAVLRERPEAYQSFFGEVEKPVDPRQQDVRQEDNPTEAREMSTFVCYYRVSTKRQGKSGLGLEAQRSAVEDYVSRHGGTVLRSFKEIESGKKADRPALADAIAFARRAKATILIAKLDRLSRNVAFLAALMESGVDFLAVDNPTANRFTVHILAAVAEFEREQISARTKAALAEKKKQGAKLGSARPGHWTGREDKRLAGLEKGRERAADIHKQRARDAYKDILPLIQELREKGMGYQTIAKELDREGYPTRRAGKWSGKMVKLILERAKED